MVYEELDLFGTYFLNLFIKDLGKYLFGVAGENDFVGISAIKCTILAALIKPIKSLP
ncbi:hypothetical protein D3C81_1335200 [compost metagenome]